MRRILPTVLVGIILSASAVLVPSVASATTPSGGVAQPPEAVLGHHYSYQFQDSVYGLPTAALILTGNCASSGYAQGLPVGLKMSSTGLVTGTTYLPEQSQFCLALGSPTFHDGVVITMTVSSGVTSLDPTLIPIGTSLAVADNNVNNEIAYWNFFLEEALSYCIPPTRYCNI